jgi:hypothetical protein
MFHKFATAKTYLACRKAAPTWQFMSLKKLKKSSIVRSLHSLKLLSKAGSPDRAAKMKSEWKEQELAFCQIKKPSLQHHDINWGPLHSPLSMPAVYYLVTGLRLGLSMISEMCGAASNSSNDTPPISAPQSNTSASRHTSNQKCEVVHNFVLT